MSDKVAVDARKCNACGGVQLYDKEGRAENLGCPVCSMHNFTELGTVHLETGED